MKLLLDQNLSRHLLGWCGQYFPESSHVAFLGLGDASDEAIWSFARDNGFTIISKDADFHHLSFVHGAPPKTVWVKLGNCSTKQVSACLSQNLSALMAFTNDTSSAFMVISMDMAETGSRES